MASESLDRQVVAQSRSTFKWRRRRGGGPESLDRRFKRFVSRKFLFRAFLLILALIAIFPPVYLHFKLRRYHQLELKKCSWLSKPPLVCAHGGDASKAFPNTMDAYHIAIRSQVDCIEIDVSRSADGVLFALHDSKDEMNRGYFADMAELKEHGGKIAAANKFIIPAMAAVKFPQLEVNYSDGKSFKLPITTFGTDTESLKANIPKATLMCLSFRATSQVMIDSWNAPFVEAFKDSEKVQLYEVSVIESWLLSLTPIKKLLLLMLKKSRPSETGVLQRQIVYAFGNHYYFRKELKILNLLTGYMFLLDKFGRIRWQGFGLATPDELSSLLSCTSLLLAEE